MHFCTEVISKVVQVPPIKLKSARGHFLNSDSVCCLQRASSWCIATDCKPCMMLHCNTLSTVSSCQNMCIACFGFLFHHRQVFDPELCTRALERLESWSNLKP